MSFTRESTVKATRKRALCAGCHREIPIGSPATRWAGMSDGDFHSVAYHPECRAAEIAMNDLKDYRSGDDWWPLSEIEHDDRPWLIDEYPAVAARLGLTPKNPVDEKEPGA